MRRVRPVLAGLTALVLAAAGYVTLDVYDVVPGVLTLDRDAAAARALPPTPTPPTPSPAATASAVPVPTAAASPLDPLATPGATTAVPTTAGLARALAAAVHDRRLGPSVGVTVRDAATGVHLLDLDASRPRTPASITKLLTATAITATLDPTERLTTRVVQGPTPADVVLVAGGDTLLSPGSGDPTAVVGHAGLADLAGRTAAALRARGVHAVRLQVDTRYAAGAPYGPAWSPVDVDEGLTGPVAMLGLSTQRPRPGHPAPRDPAMSVAQAFATALAARGVVVAPGVGRGSAPAAAVTLGAVQSAPVADVLARALADSDNALTESLARQAAVSAGRPATFAAEAAWVLATDRAQGLDLTGVHLVDTSGLSRGTLVPVRVVGDVLALAAGPSHPALRDVVARLPVAGVTGTLADRFDAAATRPAAGIAHAKTGTLTGASAVAGTVVDRDGRLLLFAVLADRVPAGWGATLQARDALDRVVAVITACGCR